MSQPQRQPEWNVQAQRYLYSEWNAQQGRYCWKHYVGEYASIDQRFYVAHHVHRRTRLEGLRLGTAVAADYSSAGQEPTNTPSTYEIRLVAITSYSYSGRTSKWCHSRNI
jgi:hypothetical protein